MLDLQLICKNIDCELWDAKQNVSFKYAFELHNYFELQLATIMCFPLKYLLDTLIVCLLAKTMHYIYGVYI